MGLKKKKDKLNVIEYTLTIACSFCNESNVDVKYLPHTGIGEFTCTKCGRKSLIQMMFVSSRPPETMMVSPQTFENRVGGIQRS